MDMQVLPGPVSSIDGVCTAPPVHLPATQQMFSRGAASGEDGGGLFRRDG